MRIQGFRYIIRFNEEYIVKIFHSENSDIIITTKNLLESLSFPTERDAENWLEKKKKILTGATIHMQYFE